MLIVGVPVIVAAVIATVVNVDEFAVRFVNAAAAGVVKPILELFIVLLVIIELAISEFCMVILRASSSTNPIGKSPILKIILLAASSSKFVDDASAGTPTPLKLRPVAVTVPPTFKFFSIQTPPATVNAPVVVLVDSSAVVISTVPNFPAGSTTLIIP